MFLMCVALWTISGCGTQTEQNDSTTDQLNKEGTESKAPTTRSLVVRTAETVAPEDRETAPEDGGYGFEEIFEDLGFTTYVVPDSELIFFGDPKAEKGGQITRIMSRFPATLRIEGQHANYVENYMFGGMIYEGLIETHPVTLEFIPSLASHWKISEDKMQFWFRINPDARWSDGKPVVADDVVATWKLHMDETILSPSDQLVYGKLELPVAESKYIVSVKCKELNWRNFLYFGGMYIYPHHYLKDLTGTDYLSDYQFKMLPGTGPYTMLEKDIKIQVSYAVTRRLDYWNADDPLMKYAYNFDKVKFVVVKDNDMLEFEKFKKGEQDFFYVKKAERWVEGTNFEAVEKGWVKKRNIFTQKPSTKYGYAFNMRKPPFDDKRLRDAFSYLINRDQMNEELFFNLFEPQNSLYAGTVYENKENEQIEFNPKKAMELLAEIGWKERNSDGWLINDEGETLRLDIAIPKAIDYRVTPVQQMLREYGIDFQIKYVDTNARWKLMMDRSFSIAFEHWGGLTFPNPETSYHSRLADEDNNNNLYGFKNARVDELCALYDVEFNQGRRIKIIQEIDKIITDNRSSFMTFYRPTDWLLFWDRYSYPEYMVSRYLNGGIEDWSVLKYWWFDAEKAQKLEDAMAKGESLPQGELDVMYWRNYVQNLEQKASEAESK